MRCAKFRLETPSPPQKKTRTNHPPQKKTCKQIKTNAPTTHPTAHSTPLMKQPFPFACSASRGYQDFGLNLPSGHPGRTRGDWSHRKKTGVLCKKTSPTKLFGKDTSISIFIYFFLPMKGEWTVFDLCFFCRLSFVEGLAEFSPEICNSTRINMLTQLYCWIAPAKLKVKL